MDKQSLRIVFLGTPDFAATSLKALLDNEFNVVGVVTAPDKPAGRGMKLQQSAVKKLALEYNLPVLQPEKLKDQAFIEALKEWKADLQIVVAFRMLPEAVWNMPRLGTINVHGSILPNYRGAAPINHAIMNGEKETGVTTFQLRHEIDTGDMLMHTKLPIGENETAGSLHDRMMHAGADLLIDTLNALLAGTLQPQPQHHIDPSEIKHAPKIHTKDCVINFNQPALKVHNHIRGLSPYPGAITQLDGKIFKIYETRLEVNGGYKPAGTIEIDAHKNMYVHCKEGRVQLLEVQMEGKKRMKVQDFLNGYQPKSELIG